MAGKCEGHSKTIEIRRKALDRSIAKFTGISCNPFKMQSVNFVNFYGGKNLLPILNFTTLKCSNM